MDVRILLITKREHPPTIKAKASVQGTCRGNADYRIPGKPHSAVQQVDTNRKETVKRLIQQFENHPNRDLLLRDLNKTEEINPSSEESKDLVTNMGNTEIFELRIAPSVGKLVSCTAHMANACSLQK